MSTRIKLDENLGASLASLFRDAGHDVETVKSEGLLGAADRDLIEICRQEDRCLVTLDMDFANPLVFDPRRYAGIAVLRVRPGCRWEDLVLLAQTLIRFLATTPVRGHLWVVQPGRLREYSSEDDDGFQEL